MGMKWFLEKFGAPLIVGGLLAIGGLFTSYFLFVVQARHSEKMLGYSDGHHYANKRLKALLRKGIPAAAIAREVKQGFQSSMFGGDQERQDLISTAQLSLGSIVFDHWL